MHVFRVLWPLISLPMMLSFCYIYNATRSFGSTMWRSAAKCGATFVAVITAMRFNTKPEELPYHIGDKIDLAVQLEAREFRGQPSLTVIVRDMKFAAFNTEKNIASLASFEKWQRGEVLSAEDKNRLYPDRACLAAIYRALRTVNGKETDQVRFVSQFGKDMTLGLFKTALLVFEERGLVHSEIADDTFTATLIETSGKTDITRSPVLLALQ